MRLSLFVVTALTLAPPVVAQDPALVEAVAPLLQAEDARAFDSTTFTNALNHPDPIVRKTAVTAIGRIGDPAGLPLLLLRLDDPDPAVVVQSFFALGLLGDRGAVGPLLDRLTRADTLTAAALDEAATALARIGGDQAAQAITEIVAGVGSIRRDRSEQMLPAAVLESWRLGDAAPIEPLLRVARDTMPGLRWRATWALARLGTAASADLLITALHDQVPAIREAAAKGLTTKLGQAARLDAAGVLNELARAFTDETAGVRINALQSAATWGDSAATIAAIPLLGDPDLNVRVAAANALGRMKGHAAVAPLDAILDDQGEAWGVRQAALLALARLDPTSFAKWGERWLASSDAHDRLAALAGWRIVPTPAVEVFKQAATDPDPWVKAAALSGWFATAGSDTTAASAAAKAAWLSDDPGLRAAALELLTRGAPTDPALDLLARAWQTGEPRIRSAVVRRLIAWARRDPGVIGRLAAPSRRALLTPPDQPELRAMAARSLPSLAAVWGPVAPIATGRTLEDYRQLAARFLLATTNPHVVIDVRNRGKIEIELLPAVAPLTVANFLKLVDRRYFDGGRWHRVVPNFVVQDGDPSGTGEGGVDWTIRDEINRLRYTQPMLGMALSGPDTGGSQWFINLSAQPHLDGRYTIFGKVVGSYGSLRRVVQGDQIISIQRTGES